MQRQQSLDFSSRQNELLSLMAGLRNVPINGYSRGAVNGVVELLQRLVLFAADLRSDSPSVDAQVSAIAARITERRSVSERTVQRWLRDARQLGLADVECLSQQYGGNPWNRYTLRLHPIRDLVYRRVGVTRGDTGRHDVGPKTRHDVGPKTRHDVGPKYGRVITSSSNTPDPEPEAGSETEDGGLGKAMRVASGLVDFRSRRVATLPARSLAVDGVYAVLREKHMRSPELIVLWFRRMLSAPSPVTGDTEAHLLLVLASGAYATSVPASEVRKSRVAIFIDTINRQSWHRVFRYLELARQQLDAMRDRWPLVGQIDDSAQIVTADGTR